ncbi:MAG: tetratricopeptide repeat protein, partial [Nitrospirota bacterium]|nr:tetratricopeptide repeat protein [Nitrospirota bacterium]
MNQEFRHSIRNTILMILVVSMLGVVNAYAIEFERVTSHPAVDYFPAPSRDGRFLAFVSERSGNPDIWLKSLNVGVVSLPRQLTVQPSADRDPSLNADGSQLLYVSHKTDPRGDIYLMDLASGKERQLTTLETGDSLPKWGPRSDGVYYLKQNVGTGISDLYRRTLANDEEKLLMDRVSAYSVGDNGWLSVAREGELIVVSESRLNEHTTLLGGDTLNVWSSLSGPDWVTVARYAHDTNGDGAIDTSDESSIWRARWDFATGGVGNLYQLTSNGNFHLYPAEAQGFVYFSDLRKGDIYRLAVQSFLEDYTSFDRALQLAGHHLDQKERPEELLVLANVARNLTKNLAHTDRVTFDFHYVETLRESGQWRLAHDVLIPYLKTGGRLGVLAGIHQEVLGLHQQIPRLSSSEIQRTVQERVAGIMSLASPYRKDDMVYGTALIESGQLFMLIEDSLTALEYLVKVDELSDKEMRAKALFARGVVYRSVGNTNSLLKVFLDVLEMFGEQSSWGIRAIGQAIAVSEQGNDVHQQTAALYGLADQQPQLPVLVGTTQLRIADLYEQAGEQLKALQALDRFLGRPPPSDSLVTQAYRRKAEILSAAERYEEAAEVYTILVGRTGEDQALLRRNQELRVLQLVRQALKERNVGEVRIAAKAFKQIIDEHPDSVEAHRGYIATKVMLKELVEVQALYHDLVSQNPNNPNIRYSQALALSYSQPADLVKIVNLLREAIRLNPGISYFHQTLGWAYEQQERGGGATGLLEQAEHSYRIALELNDEFEFPNVESNLLLNLGNTYMALSNYREAYRAYAKREQVFIPRGDSTTELLYRKNYGEACFKTSRTSESLKQFGFAVSRVPADQQGLKAELLERMGLSHQDAGQYAEAVDAFSRSLEINVELGNQKNVALLQRNVGVNLYNLSTLDDHRSRVALKKALKSYFASLELIEQVGVKEQQEGVGLLNLSVALSDDGSQAATGFDKLGEQKLMFSFIAGTYEKLDEPEPAREYYLKKLDLIATRTDSDENVALLTEKAVVLNRIGILSHQLGQNDQALDYTRHSLGYTRTLNLAYGTSVNLYNMSRLAIENVLEGHSPDPFILETLVAGLDQHLADDRADAPTLYALTNAAFLLFHLPEAPVAAKVKLEDTVQQAHMFYELKRRAWSYYHKAEVMLDNEVIPQDQILSVRMMLKLNRLELAWDGEDNKAYTTIQAELLSLVDKLGVGDRWLWSLSQAERATKLDTRKAWVRQAVDEVFAFPTPVTFSKQNITASLGGLETLSRLSVDLFVEQGAFADAFEIAERLDMRMISLVLLDKLGEEFALNGIAEYQGVLKNLFGELRQAILVGDRENQLALTAELEEIFYALQDEFPWAVSLLWQYAPPEETLPNILSVRHPYLKIVEGVNGRLHGFVHDGKSIRYSPIQRKTGRLSINQAVYDMMRAESPLYVSAPASLDSSIRALFPKEKPVTYVSSFYDFVNGYHLRSLFYSNVVMTGEATIDSNVKAGEIPLSLYHYRGDASQDQQALNTLEVLLTEGVPEDFVFHIDGPLRVRERLPVGVLSGQHHSLIMLQSIEPGSFEQNVLMSALIRTGFPHIVKLKTGQVAAGYHLASNYLAYLRDLPADEAVSFAVADASGDGGTVVAGRLFGYAGMREEEKLEFASAIYSQKLLQAVSLFQEERYEPALTNIEHALSVIHYAQKLEDLTDLTKLAVDASFKLGRYENAVFHQEKLLSLLDGESQPEEKTEALYRLGILYSRLERYEVAIQRLKEATMWWGKVEELDRLAEGVATLGVVRENMGAYSQALDEFGKSYELYEELGEIGDVATQHRRIGRIYYLRLGRYEKARERFAAALELFRELGDREGEANTLFEMGLTFEKMGLFDEAHTYYEEGIRLGEGLNDSFLLATGHLYSANIAWFQGDYQEAFQLLSQAAKFAEAAKDPQLTIMVKNTRGLMYWTLNDLDKGLVHLEQAVAMAEKEHIQTELASSLNNLGLIYRQRGDYVTALEQFEKAKAIDERLNSRWGLGYDYRNIGMALLKLDRLEEAEVQFIQAEKTSSEIKNAINWVKALLELGNVNRSLKRPDKALEYYARTYDLAKQYGIKEVQWRAASGRATILKQQGKLDDAFRWYADGVTIVEGMRAALKIDELRNSFQTNKQDLYRETITLLIRLRRTDDAFNYLERSRSRSFIDLLGNQKLTLKNEVDQAALKRIERLAVNVEALNRELGSYDHPPTEIKDQRRKAQAAYDEALLELKQQNPGLSSFVAVDPLTLTQVESRLEPGVALVSYMLGDNKSFIWLVQQKGTQFFEIPAGVDAITHTVQQYRSLVQHSEPVDTELRELYRLLITPMAKALQGVE